MDWVVWSVLQVGLIFAVGSFAALYIGVFVYYALWMLAGKTLRFSFSRVVSGSKRASQYVQSVRNKEYTPVPSPVVQTRRTAVQ